jgi:hypothetical protein
VVISVGIYYHHKAQIIAVLSHSQQTLLVTGFSAIRYHFIVSFFDPLLFIIQPSELLPDDCEGVCKHLFRYRFIYHLEKV